MDFESNIMILSCFTIVCILMILLTLFFKFHIQLVLKNCTTIEDLEKKKNPNVINVVYKKNIFLNRFNDDN